jgi:ferredoxin--NADP+ reductase
MNQQTLRVAIVGAGPAGFYSAGQLLDQHDVDVAIDIYDRLPTPHGLVRAAVAPDHPEKKLVIDNMFDYYLAHPAVRFFGSIELGKDVTHAELSEFYDAVIYSVGANDDVKMNIPGESLSGSWGAREFVAWYNGHPDYSDLEFDFSSQRAVVVGNGNVALDVARILTLSEDALRKTDIADHAIEALSKSNVKEVVIVGRRSHFQAAYNNPELEEFEHFEDVDFIVEGDELPESVMQVLNDGDWQTKRKVDTLRRLVKSSTGKKSKRVVFKFMSSPCEILGDDKVSGLKVTQNEFEIIDLNQLKLVSTELQHTINTGLLLRSIGYKGTPVAGLPFDEKTGVIPSIDGRVVDADKVLNGVYVSGWIKRGPRGVIGTNKKCARDTVRSLLDDYKTGKLSALGSDSNDIESLLLSRNPKLTTIDKWQQIDAYERSAGRNQGRPRVKLTTWQGLLNGAKA